MFATLELREHIVPLCDQVIEVLSDLQDITGNRQHLFPNLRRPTACMSKMTINRALYSMGYAGTFSGHAFRNTASTRLHELGFNTDHIEMQLAHKDQSVRARYNSAKYLEQRRSMMQAWADYLDALRVGGDVVPFRQGRGGRNKGTGEIA